MRGAVRTATAEERDLAAKIARLHKRGHQDDAADLLAKHLQAAYDHGLSDGYAEAEVDE